MQNIILSQSHDDFRLLVLCTVVTALFAYIFGDMLLLEIGYYSKNKKASCLLLHRYLERLSAADRRYDRISRSVLLVDL